MNEREARIEIACRLFDAQRLSMPEASRWAGQTRTEYEAELMNRGLPLVRPTIEEIRENLATLERLGI